MAKTKQIEPATTDLTPALAENRANRLALIEWTNYAKFQAESGNTSEAMSAISEVAAIAQLVDANSELTENLLSGLKSYADKVEAQLDQTIIERDELQADIEHQVIDMAVKIAQGERERLLHDDNAVEEAIIEDMSQRMIDYGYEAVAQEEEDNKNFRLRRAKQLAQRHGMIA